MAKRKMELDSLIHGQFPSQAAFARHIGWHKQKVNRIVSGNMMPSIEDVQTIAEGLNIPFMMVVKFFLK